jgi:hypothetical protein
MVTNCYSCINGLYGIYVLCNLSVFVKITCSLILSVHFVIICGPTFVVLEVYLFPQLLQSVVVLLDLKKPLVF